VDANRWRMQYVDGLIRTDILDFERIHDFKAMQMVLDVLPVGPVLLFPSPLSRKTYRLPLTPSKDTFRFLNLSISSSG